MQVKVATKSIGALLYRGYDDYHSDAEEAVSQGQPTDILTDTLDESIWCKLVNFMLGIQ